MFYSPFGVLQVKLTSISIMPGERRNLRSNKETSSSTNGEKARSNSQSSSSKDKPVPTRATSSKSKALPKKAPAKESSGDKPQTNGTEPIENGVNGSDDIDMVDDGPEKVKVGKEGEDEMTVVVPPSKGSKLSGEPSKADEGDVNMDTAEAADAAAPDTNKIDPRAKAITGE